jgi:uncharacterized protein with PIN domain
MRGHLAQRRARADALVRALNRSHGADPAQARQENGGRDGHRGSRVTLYGDPSSLVKLYVLEAGTAEICTLVARGSVVVTSAIAYVEMRAALARLRRERRLTPRAYRAARDPARAVTRWSRARRVRGMLSTAHHHQSHPLEGICAASCSLPGFSH